MCVGTWRSEWGSDFDTEDLFTPYNHGTTHSTWSNSMLDDLALVLAQTLPFISREFLILYNPVFVGSYRDEYTIFPFFIHKF